MLTVYYSCLSMFSDYICNLQDYNKTNYNKFISDEPFIRDVSTATYTVEVAQTLTKVRDYVTI